jgi:O-antigen/teichoic acid export membrane protein
LNDVIWIAAGAGLISLLLALRILRGKLLRLERGGALRGDELWPIAVPLWINGVLTQLLTQADIWILTAVVGNEQIAIYGAAAFMVAFVSQPLILVNLVVPPYIADLYARGEPRRLERILRQTATLAGLPALVLLLAFVFFGEPILGLVYPDYIRAGAPVLAFLSVGKLVNVLTGSCGVTMMMTGHQRVLLAITFATGVLTVVGCLVLVGPYGMIGVAGAVSGGTILKNIAMWLETKRRTGMWTHVGIPKPEEVRSLLHGIRTRATGGE